MAEGAKVVGHTAVRGKTQKVMNAYIQLDLSLSLFPSAPSMH